tara:strand:- start:3389 stop:3610 length:222 start_codon:yes stop_codon:yes gene_type:complete
MEKDKGIENIFNSPMLLRNWAVNLISSLGNSAIQQKADTDKVDELIGQFVEDYNFHYEKLYMNKENQEKNEEE